MTFVEFLASWGAVEIPAHVTKYDVVIVCDVTDGDNGR